MHHRRNDAWASLCYDKEFHEFARSPTNRIHMEPTILALVQEKVEARGASPLHSLAGPFCIRHARYLSRSPHFCRPAQYPGFSKAFDPMQLLCNNGRTHLKSPRWTLREADLSRNDGFAAKFRNAGNLVRGSNCPSKHLTPWWLSYIINNIRCSEQL